MAGQATGDAGTRRRWSGLLAVLAGLAYVGWRAYDTLTGVAPWLAITALTIEAAGLAGTTALIAALRRPRRSATVAPPAAADEQGPIDVVVRFDGQSIGHLHATLAGVRHMFDVRRVAVITDRVDEATKAVRGTAVEVVEPDPKDATRLRAAAAFGDAPFVAVFDAGDVPQPGFTGVVRGAFVDPGIGVSQGCLEPDGVDSAEHDARGHHELRFEREVLNPSLGGRGAAVFSGSGAIIRRSLLQTVPVPRGARRSAELRWSIAARSAGHALVAPYRPIVSTASINTERAVMAERRRSTRAVLATLMSRHDPLWTTHLRLSHRAGYLAWMVRPLSGLRRLAFVGVLVACMVISASPIRPQSSAWVVAGLWAAWFVAQGWAIEQMSDRRLRPGDRTRWSMRTMGASAAALAGAGRAPAGESVDADRSGGWRNAGRNPFLVFALLTVAATSVVIGVDRWQPFLEPVTSRDAEPWMRAALAAVAVWTVASMLDVMRCLVGGPRLRAAQRLPVRLDATIDDAEARITNLSPRGAGVQFEHEPDLIVGDQVAMRFLVPTGSGTAAEVATIATVRSIRYDDPRRGPVLLCGVEFGTMDRISADALFAYCSIVQPVDAGAPRVDGELVAGSSSQQRFLGVRLLGVLAVAGIGAATMPPYGSSAAATADSRHDITVHLVDAVTGAGIDGAALTATCVAARRVVDDRDVVMDIARTAIRRTRTQQRARLADAQATTADRNLRRENVPSKRSAQEVRWRQDQDDAMGVVDEPSAAGDDPAAVDWHHVPAVQTTDSEAIDADGRGGGAYVFSDLPGWPCRVEAVAMPAGYGPAPTAVGGGGFVQFADGGDVLSMSARPVDAAAAPTIEIGNRVWLDTDGDGVQGASEPGLAGVAVTLTVDGVGYRGLTDADGDYRFSSTQVAALRVGSVVQITAPVTLQRGSSSFHLTISDAAGGTRPSIDSSVDPATGGLTFTVGSTIEQSIDIGYAQTHALGDRVWLDADNDGLRGPGEQGVDDVTVLLYTDAEGDGVPDGDAVDAQVTTQGGLYAFAGLPAGRYIVEVHPPNGMVSSTGSIGHLDGPFEPAAAARADDDDDGTMLDSGVIRSGTVTLGDTPSPTGEASVPDTTAGAVMAGVPDVRGDATVDFGLFAPRAIDDALWLDEDGDGHLSPDEPGLPDVPLTLVRGDQVVAVTTSDADGDFVFPNLTLGDYTVQVQAPPGLRPIASLPPQTDDDELVSVPDDTDGSEQTDEAGATVATEVTAPSDVVEPELAATAPVTAEDPDLELIPVTIAPDWAGPDSGRALQRFGLWAPRSIGHMVWEDADDDGVLDAGEVGIPGMKVSLIEGDRVVARALSAVDGSYRFVDLPDGTYRVAIDVPPTWRTSSVAWDDASSVVHGIDQSARPRTTDSALSPPIRVGRVDVDTSGSFESANLGLFQPRPAVTLDLSNGEDQTLTAGSTHTWTDVVSNSGNVPLSDLTVTDDSTPAATIDCNGTVAGDGQPLLLDVGHSVTCTSTTTVAVGRDHRSVTVHATGESSPGSIEPLPAVAATANWVGSPPSLALRTLVKLTSPGPDADGDGVLDAGSTPRFDAVDDAGRPRGTDPTGNHVVAESTKVWWVYEVQNTGAHALSDVAVSDQQRGRVCSGLALASGERRYCVVPEVVTRDNSRDGRVHASAVANGLDLTDPLVRVVVGPATDGAEAFVVQPGVSVAVSVDGAAVAPSSPAVVVAGSNVDVAYAVTNTGDAALASVVLTDAAGAPIVCPQLDGGSAGIEPGETVTCTVPMRPDAPASPGQVPIDLVAHVEAQPVAVESGPVEPVMADVSWSYVVSTVAVANEAFIDADADAVRGADDASVAGIEVRLLDDDDQIVATTTTDANGQWSFVSLVPGVYSIEYVVLPDFLVAVTTPTGARFVAADGDGGTLVTSRAMVDGVSAQPSWQLALVRPASSEAPPSSVPAPPTGLTRIEDRVWNDADGNGWLTSGETGFTGVIVTLVDASGSTARPVAVSATDHVGRFMFDRVPAGKYVVAIGVVVDGTALAELDTTAPVASLRDPAEVGSTVRAAGAAGPIVVDQRSVLQPQLSLSISPDAIGRLVPGRMPADGPSILDPADAIPSSPTEVGQAMVFVMCLVVFSLVIATARRRRPAEQWTT